MTSVSCVLEEWVPLYVGKSKKVSAPVAEHLCLPLDARTFALKICAIGGVRSSTIGA